MAQSGVTGADSARAKRNPTGALRIYGSLRPPVAGVPAAFRRDVGKFGFPPINQMTK
jgi:hypothetical protein